MRFLLLLTIFSFLSCAKEEAAIGNEQILGQWLQTSKNQVEARYVITSRFSQFDYGLIFFDNGQYIDRSESGICIGDDCLTENFNGTYRWISTDIIELMVDNYHGLSTRQYVVETPAEGELVLKMK